MTQTLSADDSLVCVVLSHLPRKGVAAEQTRDKLLTLGFFDEVEVRQMNAGLMHSIVDTGGQRHQRVLLAFGNFSRVQALVKETKQHPCYLSISLVKLCGPEAHEKYHSHVKDLTAPKDKELLELVDTVCLGCLDAPDVLVFRLFRISGQKSSLGDLVNWMGSLRRLKLFEKCTERSLTIIAYGSLKRLEELAEKEEDGKVQALVRMTDLCGGWALQELRKSVREEYGSDIVGEKLFATNGYYDVQGMVSLRDAARILTKAEGLSKDWDLMSSTCLIGRQDLQDVTKPDRSKHTLLVRLESDWKLLKIAAGKLVVQNSGTLEVVEEAVLKFHRLSDAGLIPGSRMLLWTCQDAIARLTAECENHDVARKDETDFSAQEQDGEFHDRQRNYGLFFRAISDELDRRVSLSLSAHTRVFPCAIEAPLKLVGALDVAGRLVGASLRSFRCRTHSGQLHVFTTSWEKPSHFFTYPRTGAHRINPTAAAALPFATMVVTKFSPRMVQHFYLSLFTVFHEVAQCVIQETIEWPSFTALVYSQAMLERVTTITTLAYPKTEAGVPHSVPVFILQWGLEFLVRETGLRTVAKKHPQNRVTPKYFQGANLDLGEREPKDPSWIEHDILESQLHEWAPKRVTKRETASPQTEEDEKYIESLVVARAKLHRDSRHCTWLMSLIETPSFRAIWAREIYNRFTPIVRREARHSPDGYTTPPHPLMTTPDDPLRVIRSEIRRWEKANAMAEYLEVASLLPFLRLFADADGYRNLSEVIVLLARDHTAVWKETVSPQVNHEVGRRFVVMLAAVACYSSPENATGDSLDAEANSRIRDAVIQAAGRLAEHVSHTAENKTLVLWHALWKSLAGDPVPANNRPVDYDEDMAHVIILIPMVRFLVRLMHIYSRSSEHLDSTQAKAVDELNDYMRRIFVNEYPRNTVAPLRQITELWSFQYSLTQKLTKEGCLFKLSDVVNLLPKNPPMPDKHD